MTWAAAEPLPPERDQYRRFLYLNGVVLSDAAFGRAYAAYRTRTEARAAAARRPAGRD